MRTGQVPNQMRCLCIDPLVDGFGVDRGQFSTIVPELARNQFWGPPLHEVLFNFIIENTGFKAHSSVSFSMVFLRPYLCFVGEVVLQATARSISSQLSAKGAGGPPYYFANVSKPETSVEENGNLISFFFGKVCVGSFFHACLLYSRSCTSVCCTSS